MHLNVGRGDGLEIVQLAEATTALIFLTKSVGMMRSSVPEAELQEHFDCASSNIAEVRLVDIARG